MVLFRHGYVDDRQHHENVGLQQHNQDVEDRPAGAEYDLIAFLVARYFGMKSYGVIYGALYSFFAVGAGIGPPVFGAAYDRSHSYAAPLTFAGVAMLAGALALLGLGRYRIFDQPAGAVIIAEAETTADSRAY